MQDVYIAGAARTAIGSFQGVFAPLTAPVLGGEAVRAAMADAGAEPDTVDEIIMGCVLPAGQRQAPARQAGFNAGLPESAPAVTLNKMCGSGMKAVMTGYDQTALGETGVMVCGGMESMTNAPHILPRMRPGVRMGNAEIQDHLFTDGLEDAYDKGRLMGAYAEDCAEAFQFTREDQDAYALASLSRANAAHESGAFADEITPVEVKTRRGAETVNRDEQPGAARPDKIPHLKPAFREGGTVTAANSSSISDGAAALIIASGVAAEKHGLKRRARIIGHATHAQAPAKFTTAPIPAAQKLLEKIGWKPEDVDLWEINEAFAVVPMAFMRELGLDSENVNVNGGACALGHPVGASGARILVTLLNALEKRGLKRGVAAICIGGGEGTAMAVERV
ncbi:MAG: thiolase family protein [Rhodospirillales bacterium]